jgi:hypothetical protein
MAIDKDLLFKPRLDEDAHEIAGVGTVRFRALTRAEALQVVGREMPYDEMERMLLSLAMVDPPLTSDEVARWQQACPAGELEPICSKIQELSGLQTTMDKQAYRHFRGNAGDRIRVLSGGQARNDGRSTPADDQ